MESLRDTFYGISERNVFLEQICVRHDTSLFIDFLQITFIFQAKPRWSEDTRKVTAISPRLLLIRESFRENHPLTVRQHTSCVHVKRLENVSTSRSRTSVRFGFRREIITPVPEEAEMKYAHASRLIRSKRHVRSNEANARVAAAARPLLIRRPPAPLAHRNCLLQGSSPRITRSP